MIIVAVSLLLCDADNDKIRYLPLSNHINTRLTSAESDFCLFYTSLLRCWQRRNAMFAAVSPVFVAIEHYAMLTAAHCNACRCLAFLCHADDTKIRYLSLSNHCYTMLTSATECEFRRFRTTMRC